MGFTENTLVNQNKKIIDQQKETNRLLTDLLAATIHANDLAHWKIDANRRTA